MNIKKTIYISIIIFLSVVFLRLFVFRGKSEQISRVVIITIDTLRADHLGSYGYKLNTSPFLDSIAKQGISFKNTFAATASTVPSHASLFTSLHPLQHGVLKNGHKLADDFLTMAEIFQEIGYKTAGITSTDRHFFVSNLHQGFSYYNEPTNLICFKLTKLSFRKLNENGVPNKILEKLQLLKKKAFPDKFTFLKTIEKQIGEEQTFKFQESLIKYAEFDMRYRSAQETIDVAINWLETIQPTEKFFLWIHLFDPHWPLRPPKMHSESIEDLTNEETLFNFLLGQHHIEFAHFDNNKTKMLRIIKTYDAEVHYADFELQRFFHYYQKKGFDTRSLWIITADHGQGLGNHNWLKHGIYIYNEQLRVPLIFYFSSKLNKGTVIDHIVEHVDIFPTVFEIIGRNIEKNLRIQGESLTPFIFPNPGTTYKKKFAFSQRRVYSSQHLLSLRSGHIETICENGEKYALQSQNYKYILCTHGMDEFFDLRSDPYEIHNLIESGSLEEQQLKNTLLAIINELKKHAPSKRLTVDKETTERLKSLGYIQ